ncbi:NARE ribosyltransferase, partial [Baryphthengus martii]|nr:NARE ribosyltransferase [Baryphthengus martii]
MEHLALGLVLLVRTLAIGSPLHRRDLKTVKIKMDMAPTSFDDQYQGCTSMMEEELAELNRTEFNKNKVYAETWTEAAKGWWSYHSHIQHKTPLRSEQAIALLVYTYNSPRYKKFNEAVRMAGSSRECYLDNFHFKVLHFFLTEALRALRDAQPDRCYNVYRGVNGTSFTVQQHQSVRFGQFTSSSLQRSVAESFGQDTFFFIETCHGVPIENYSYFPKEEEVLIPPFESFEVTKVTHDGYRSFINLRSKDAKSTYNCEFVKGDVPVGQAAPDRPFLAPTGSSISEEPPRLWLLLLAAMALAVAGSP